ncbi:hypothetical protein Dimus_021681 [Dionaea muscipula]
MSDDDVEVIKGRKRFAIMGISSLLLVAMVVAVSLESRSIHVKKEGGEISASMKAVQAICQPTDFKDTCINSLSSMAPNSTDPKDLIKASFEVAINEINNVTTNSPLFKELQKNPETKRAADDCKELFQDAIDDLRRSFHEVGQFDFDHSQKILSNLKIWLSASITYQETCLDGFDNTTGDASEKMRELLETSMELSSNGLAIITELSSVINTMQITTFQRRLLMTPSENNSDDVLSNIDSLIRWRRLLASSSHRRDHDHHHHHVPIIKKGRAGRHLLMTTTNMVVGLDGLPSWLDEPRRKLLHAASSSSSSSPLALIQPNVTVAQDGSGNYTTIAEAIDQVPKWNNHTFIIYIKEGVYYEYLRIDKWLTHVVLIGDGPTKTRISYDLNFIDGTPTFKTATLSVLAGYFMAKDIGVENTAGASKHQAVAIRVQSDMSIFYNCHFDGFQDTLYAHTYRQFYRDCKISGTIDFVFGDAASFFQNCTFVVRRPLENQNCIVTAQGRKERHQPTGIIIHKSLFTADPDYYPVRFTNKAYLARPWKEYSKTIIMESYIEDLIHPEGWLPWFEDFGLNTCYYGEYNNAGPGADMTGRVKWRGVKTIVTRRAEKFMPPIFFGNDDWIRESGVPYIPNLTTAPPPELSALPPGVVDEDPNAPAPASSPSPAHSDESSSKKNESKSHDHESSSKKNESKSHDHESSSKKKESKYSHDDDESSSKKHEESKSSHDESSSKKSGSESHDDESSSKKSESESHDNESSSKKSESESHDDESSSKKSESKSHDDESSSKKSDSESHDDESSSKKSESKSHEDGQISRSHRSKARGHDSIALPPTVSPLAPSQSPDLEEIPSNNLLKMSTEEASRGQETTSTEEASQGQETMSSEEASQGQETMSSEEASQGQETMSSEEASEGQQTMIQDKGREAGDEEQPRRPLIIDLERVLMEEGGEEEGMVHDDIDMMASIPDGDEPSRAFADHHNRAQAPISNELGVAPSPSTSISNVLGVAPSPSRMSNVLGAVPFPSPKRTILSQSSSSGPSQATVQADNDEDDDIMAELSAPASSPTADDAAVSSPAPAPAPSGSVRRTSYGAQIILSGLAIWAALVM